MTFKCGVYMNAIWPGNEEGTEYFREIELPFQPTTGTKLEFPFNLGGELATVASAVWVVDEDIFELYLTETWASDADEDIRNAGFRGAWEGKQ